MKQEKNENVYKKLDQILSDFRRCERWLEAAARWDLLNRLAVSGRNRYLEGLLRLKGMLDAYLKIVIVGQFELRVSVASKEIEMMPEIECTKCGWQGYVLDLWCHPEDEDKPVNESRFNVCPDCGAIDSWEDYED